MLGPVRRSGPYPINRPQGVLEKTYERHQYWHHRVDRFRAARGRQILPRTGGQGSTHRRPCSTTRRSPSRGPIEGTLEPWFVFQGKVLDVREYANPVAYANLGIQE